jgi:flagellar biogenesis protein FliO
VVRRPGFMDAQAPEIPGLGGAFAVTFLSLGLVCLLAYATVRWVLRPALGQARGPIRVLARCSPEPRRSLFLIQTAGRCFLVGASEGGMTLLAEVDPQEIGKELSSEDPAGSRLYRATRGRFREILTRVLARPVGTESGPGVPPSAEPGQKG